MNTRPTDRILNDLVAHSNSYVVDRTDLVAILDALRAANQDRTLNPSMQQECARAYRRITR